MESEDPNLSSFEQFCGGPFWSSNLTWHTAEPQFTECFQRTVLSWIPGTILLAYLPFEIRNHHKSQSRNVPLNWYNLFKIFLTIVLVSVSISRLVVAATDDDDRAVADAEYVTGVYFVVVYSASLVLLGHSIRYGMITSPGQFTFYGSSVLCGAFTISYISKR
jgi:ATP-binding cassette subfamily C (CFTR/MRP) protein 1